MQFCVALTSTILSRLRLYLLLLRPLRLNHTFIVVHLILLWTLLLHGVELRLIVLRLAESRLHEDLLVSLQAISIIDAGGG